MFRHQIILLGLLFNRNEDINQYFACIVVDGDTRYWHKYNRKNFDFPCVTIVFVYFVEETLLILSQMKTLLICLCQ